MINQVNHRFHQVWRRKSDGVSRNKKIDFSRLLGHFYDAALAPERWPVALEAAGDALGGCAFVMSILPAGEGRRFVTGARVDLDDLQLIQRRYAVPSMNDLLAAVRCLPPNTLVLRESIQTDSEYFQSELYNEVFRHQRLTHVAVACVHRTQNYLVPIGVLQHKRKRPPKELRMKLLSALLPHMRRSIQLQLRLISTSARYGATTHFLEQLPMGISILDSSGTILFVNRTALDVFASGDCLTERAGHLRVVSPNDQDDFEHLIRDAAATVIGKGGGGGAIKLKRGPHRHSLCVHIMPVMRSSGPFELSGSGGLASVLVIITDPEDAPPSIATGFAKAYKLTSSETELAQSLVQGKTLREYAEIRKIATETARWRLKQVFAKTSCRSQSDLIRLLLSGTRIPQLNKQDLS